MSAFCFIENPKDFPMKEQRVALQLFARWCAPALAGNFLCAPVASCTECFLFHRKSEGFSYETKTGPREANRHPYHHLLFDRSLEAGTFPRTGGCHGFTDPLHLHRS